MMLLEQLQNHLPSPEYVCRRVQTNITLNTMAHNTLLRESVAAGESRGYHTHSRTISQGSALDRHLKPSNTGSPRHTVTSWSARQTNEGYKPTTPLSCSPPHTTMIFPSAALLLTWTIALLGVLKPHAVDTLFSTLAHVNILTLPSVATFVQVASCSVMRLALEPPTLGDALTNQPHIPFHPTATSRSHPALSSTFFDPRAPQHFGERSFWPHVASMFVVFALVCSVIAASVVAPYVLMHSWSKLPRDVQDLLLGTPSGSRFELPRCPHTNPLHDPATIQVPPPCHEDILSSPHHSTWFLASPSPFDSHSDLIPPPPTPEVQPGSPDPAVLVSHSVSSLSYIPPDLTDDDDEDDSEDDSCTHPYEARFNYSRSLPDGEEEEAMAFYEARHNYFMSIPEDEQAALWEGLELLEQLVAMTDREFAEYLESQDADSLEKFMLLLAYGNWFMDYVCGRRPEGEERWVFPEELWYFRWIEIVDVPLESPRLPESWLWNSWD